MGRAAMARDMVLQIHTTRMEMAHLVGQYPDARLVFPHLGGGADEIRERIADVAKHPRACFEISGSGHERMGMLEYAVQTIGEDRVLFGSDFTINDIADILARVEASYLTDLQKEKILHLNVERILRAVGAAGV